MKDKPYIQKLQEAGHELILTKSGEIDIFRYEVGHHNGPECIKCGKSWCHHCERKIEPCVKNE